MRRIEGIRDIDHPRWKTSAAIFAAPFSLIRSGIAPGKNDPKTWYGRAIRLIGGLFLIGFFALIILVFWMDQLRK